MGDEGKRMEDESKRMGRHEVGWESREGLRGSLGVEGGGIMEDR